MVEVRVSRAGQEVLAAEGTVGGVTRTETQVVAGLGDDTGEARVSRASLEVLAAEPGVAAVTRIETQVAAGLGDGTSEAQISRASLEVLAAEDARAGVTRIETQVAANMDGSTEVRVSRVGGSVLARQGATSTVTPLDVADDSFIFLHNWATKAELRTSFRNTLSYSPDSGAESRRGLGVKPFRTMKLEWLVCDGADVARLERLEVLLRRIGDARFQVPIYMDQQELDASYLSTASTILVPTNRARFFPGARVVIIQIDADYHPTSFTFHIIESLTNDSITFVDQLGVDVPAGSLVMPVMDCEIMLEVEADYSTARIPRVVMTVSEAPGTSQLPVLKADTPTGAETYNGYPIWFEEPDWSEGVLKGRRRYGDRSNSGRADLVTPEGDRSRQYHSYSITGKREELWQALEFFETRRGRLRAFWHIDQDQYMQPAAIDPSGTFVSVSEVGDLTDFEEEFDYVGVVMNDGQIFVREAVTIQQVLTVFRITVDTPIATGLSASNANRIARARLSRFESDEFIESWSHTGYMQSSIEIIEVLNEDNYPII